jgi:hypothetical protein
MILTLRSLVGVCALLLSVAILWALGTQGGLHGSFLDQLDVLTTLPWGVVSLVDLYVGFVFFTIIIFLAERSWLAAVMWSLPIYVLGNVWVAVWLVVRLPSLARRINRPDLEDR